MAEEFFGLDIGTSQIKIAEVKDKNSPNPTLSIAAITKISGRGILSDASADHEALANQLAKFVSDSKVSTSNCVSALPESQIFTRVIPMPVLNDKELASAIRWEAEQYIPVPQSEVNLAWQVLSRPQGVSPESKMDVLLIAAPKILVEKYMKVLQLAGLKPVSLETEILAITRSLGAKDSALVIIIAIGAYTTDICIAKGGILLQTRSIATGGEAFTRAVAEELGFEREQAEEYKKNYGLLEDQLEGKIATMLKPVFEILVGEIKKVISSYEAKRKEKIHSAVLSGGGAAMPGIIEYLAQELDMEVEIGDPWAKLKFGLNIPKSVLDERLFFGVATGLAMKKL